MDVDVVDDVDDDVEDNGVDGHDYVFHFDDDDDDYKVDGVGDKVDGDNHDVDDDDNVSTADSVSNCNDADDIAAAAAPSQAVKRSCP